VPDVRAIRSTTGLSQPKFAAKYGLSLAALRDWEQGRRQPTQSARILLHVIHYEPDAVDRAILKAREPRE
jgi:putative transcriptional regulator